MYILFTQLQEVRDDHLGLGSFPIIFSSFLREENISELSLEDIQAPGCETWPTCLESSTSRAVSIG